MTIRVSSCVLLVTLAVIVADARAAALTFEDRVSCATAVEEVYWRHRAWPNAGPKPALAVVLPRGVIETRVADGLRRTRALEVLWGRPITAERLQAEMDRMARASQTPDILREIFTALGNDPQRVAECVARPLLSERLARQAYAFDPGIHAEVRSRAERELQRVAHGQRTGVTESEWARREFEAGAWRRALARLAGLFKTPVDRLPLDQFSSLQEDEGRFYALAILERSEARVRVATVQWRKAPFDEWWASVRQEFGENVQINREHYRLPAVAARCLEGTWSPTAVVEGRTRHATVWTGSEMIVWGGSDLGYMLEEGVELKSGARYDPATDTWRAVNLVGAPSPRLEPSAVWTGGEMIVWGGWSSYGAFDTGGRYNPTTDTWTATSTMNAPSATVFGQTAVWTGTEMIVWKPWGSSGRYDPGTDSWTTVSATDAPTDVYHYTAVWTGSVMIVWGGYGSYSVTVNTGSRYDPSTDTWAATSTVDAPSGRAYHSAVWTGSEMIVWGGTNGTNGLDTGGRYDPGTDTWNPAATANAPSVRYLHNAVWTGSRMIVWGGLGSAPLDSGALYDPAADTWTPTAAGTISARYAHSGVWTGSEMIIWGGIGHDFSTNTGGRYDPVADSWTATSTIPAPKTAFSSAAVWTGSEMIVWGGDFEGDTQVDSAGRYDPATDSWRPISLVGGPSRSYPQATVWTGREMIAWVGEGETPGARYDPTTDTWAAMSVRGAPTNGYIVPFASVWTGREMIVWSGTGERPGGRYDPALDAWASMSVAGAPKRRYREPVWTGREMLLWEGEAGGRYDPVNDTWRPISALGAPREAGSTVWTGREMILWGGIVNTNTGFVNTGARYDPVTDTWRPTSTSGAPIAREGHSAIWTGSEMIVWGGESRESGHLEALDTGGAYDPVTDSWTPTGIEAPRPRQHHVALWTGRDMIVWGGSGSYLPFNFTSGGRYCAQRNRAPVARNDHYRTRQAGLTVLAPGVLGNDFEADGDPLTATLISGPSKGRVTLRADGSFTYTPQASFNGFDRFVYEVSDGRGGVDRASVVLTRARTCPVLPHSAESAHRSGKACDPGRPPAH